MKSLAVPPHNSKHRLMGEMCETNFCSFSSVTLKALPLVVIRSFAVTQQVYIWLWNLFSASKMCLHKTAAPELRLPLHSIPFPRSPFVFFFKVRLPALLHRSLRRFPSLLCSVAGSHRLPIPIVLLASCFAVYFPVQASALNASRRVSKRLFVSLCLQLPNINNRFQYRRWLPGVEFMQRFKFQVHKSW